MRLRLLHAALVGTALFAAAASTHDASACGGFFRASTTAALPSLSVERVLLVHDRAKEWEHFIREVAFKDASEPFGFVVPVPSKPEVAKVDDPPFARLDRTFPYPIPSHARGGGGIGLGTPGGIGHGAGHGVEVLSQEKIGSFTAFVLAATDATALQKWLADNKLQSTPATEAWLAHYVRLKFFYVAFRYDPPSAKSDGKLRSETVRISFATPHPYYPYLEPDHDQPSRDRVLALWFVSDRPMVPIAAAHDDGAVHWKKPWRAGQRFPMAAEARVKEAVGDKLAAFLPAAVVSTDPLQDPGSKTLVVETFEDQKSSRKGWGDVLFVPEKPDALDAIAVEKRKSLLAILDPSLEGAP